LKIYSAEFSKGFHDVTNGTNLGCGTLGFNAAQGLDPVTSLGTPDFPSLPGKWLALQVLLKDGLSISLWPYYTNHHWHE
jgi:hypothetical protein